MTVGLELIKELRAITGVSITACKKALDEANGDIDKAIEVLRKKGEAKAADRADRNTDEGVVSVAVANGKAVMIKLASETDFVAKNQDFVDIAADFAKRLLADSKVDLGQDVSDLSLKMGEKIELKDPVFVEGAVVGSYVHSNNKVAALVALSSSTDEVARNIAMHATAMKPKYLSPDQVTAEMIAKEKEIWTNELKESGKPESIWDNIMAGKEKKFREAAALKTQEFVMDPSKTVEAYAKDNGADITSFAYLA